MAVDRDDAAHVKLGVLPEPIRQSRGQVNRQVIGKGIVAGTNPDPSPHVVLADIKLPRSVAAQWFL
jgi:hypothetical protein